MPTLRWVGPTNGFIPEATGQVVGFIRKPERFPLNRYCKYFPTPKTVGVYPMLGRDHPVRIVSNEEFVWEDGDWRPQHRDQQQPFTWQEFQTNRLDYGFTLGYKAIDQTNAFRLKPVHMAAAISQAMTNRTNRVVTLLDTAANWGSNSAAANSLNNGAGKWDTASDDPNSPFYEAIYGSLIEAYRRIHLATNGTVTIPEMKVIVGPGAAIKISKAPELVNYVRETPQARQFLEGGFDPQFDKWGLPSRYRGFEFVVEDSPIVTVREAVSTLTGTAPLHPAEASIALGQRGYIKGDTTAVMVTRTEGVDGDYGAPDFSTVQVYHYGSLLEVEAFDRPRHRLVEGHVSEDIKEVLMSNLVGFQITNIT